MFLERKNCIKLSRNVYLLYDIESTFYILNHNVISFGFDVSGEGYIHMYYKRSIYPYQGRD